MSPRISFQAELAQLTESLAEMAASVERTFAKLFQAHQQQNQSLIREIAASEKMFGDMQRSIESQCLFLITKQQPLAGDLRIVTASLKVVTDIERVGDHVTDMAELLLRLKAKELETYSGHLPPMIQKTQEMLHEATQAFFRRDPKTAQQVVETDDIIDDLFNKVKGDSILCLRTGSQDADECIDFLMLAKYLEKIGDHAENIGEWEIFQETGNMRDVRLL